MKHGTLGISSTVSRLLYDNPFLAVFITKMDLIKTDKIPTMAVGINSSNRINLYYNEEFWDKLQQECKLMDSMTYKYSLLMHEASHVILQHLIPSILTPKLGTHTEQEDAVLRNIAMDLEINYSIGRKNMPNPDTNPDMAGYFLEDMRTKYPDLKWDPNEHWYVYYKELLKLPKEEQDKLTGGPPMTIVISNNSGKKGSSSGSGNSSMQGMQDVIFLDGDKMTPEDSDRAKGLIERAVETSWDELSDFEKSKSKIRGFGSLSIEDIIKKIISSRKPVVNWKQYLKQFVSHHTSDDKRFTYRKRSKRYPLSQGQTATPETEVLVYVDVSGSVSDSEISELLVELKKITTKKFRMIQFGSSIISDEKFKHNYQFLRKDSGGTDFKIVMEHINKQKHIDCVVLFTDGYGGDCGASKYPLIWLLSSAGMTVDDCKKQYRGQGFFKTEAIDVNK